jgi:hypothetical protein
MRCCEWTFDHPHRGPGAAAEPGEPAGSGSRAFDEYRAATLRRLEAEQRDFHDFLRRLRAAKDQAEFDRFVADRADRKPAAPPPQQNAGP